MPQRQASTSAAFKYFSSIRFGSVQLKNVLPRPALHEPRQQDKLLSLSCAKNVLLTTVSGFIFLA